MTFPAQSPDLRRFPLVAGASRSVVRSPRSAAPRIRFLFVDSRVRFTLRSAYASRRTPCASLRSLRPGSGRTFTSKSSPMPGPPQKQSALGLFGRGRSVHAGSRDSRAGDRYLSNNRATGRMKSSNLSSKRSSSPSNMSLTASASTLVNSPPSALRTLLVSPSMVIVAKSCPST